MNRSKSGPGGRSRDQAPDPDPRDFAKSALRASETLLWIYPQSTLADIYKSFFQDEFGPGHLLEDPASARRYFERELSTMTSRGRHHVEPCGIGRHFCRGHLDAIVDGLVDADRFFAAFLSAATAFRLPQIATWAGKWDSIVAAIRPLRPVISGFEGDAEAIRDALANGTYVMHHSQRYTAAYDPHYRLLRVGDALP